MPLSDREIRKLCLEQGMVSPFSEAVSGNGIISYGLTSSGYDIRLGYDFKIFKNSYGIVVDPKRFKNDDGYADRVFDTLHTNQPVIIPPGGYILGGSLERFDIPRHIHGTCVGKSTYARCAISLNVTPLEPGWCASEDTEILTEGGWKLVKDAQMGEKALTRRPDGVAEYREIEKTHAVDYHGNLLWFQGRSVDQLVTPDHKMFVWGYWNQPKLIAAKDIFGRWNYRFDRVVRREAEGPQKVNVAGREYDADTFAVFYGCWLGDGSAYKGTDGGYHIKLAAVTKERKRILYRSVLADMGVAHFREAERGFEWFDKDLCCWLMQHGHAKDKFVLSKFRDQGVRFSERLLFGLLSSDGNAQTKTITTASPKLADDIQILAFHSGIAAIVRKTESYISGETFIAYKVRLCDDHMRPDMPPQNHSLVPYDGKVYCVTVPNHVWFCRRNGKASWTGNCGYLTLEISNDSLCPVMVYPGEGIAQIVFHRIDGEVEKSYADKGKDGSGGKYQDQDPVTLAKVE